MEQMLEAMENSNHMQPHSSLPPEWESVDGVTLVCFSTEWSGISIMMRSVIGNICQELQQSILVVQVDIDREPELARRFMVERVPTILIIHRNELKEQIEGIVPNHQLSSKLGALLDTEKKCSGI